MHRGATDGRLGIVALGNSLRKKPFWRSTILCQATIILHAVGSACASDPINPQVPQPFAAINHSLVSPLYIMKFNTQQLQKMAEENLTREKPRKTRTCDEIFRLLKYLVPQFIYSPCWKNYSDRMHELQPSVVAIFVELSLCLR